jgi:hypothetical protein
MPNLGNQPHGTTVFLTSNAHRWQSDVIALSTCSILGVMPHACWLSPLAVFCRFIELASASVCAPNAARQGAGKTLLPRGCPSSFRAALSHALGPSSNPIGMSMPRQARSNGRSRSHNGCTDRCPENSASRATSVQPAKFLLAHAHPKFRFVSTGTTDT